MSPKLFVAFVLGASLFSCKTINDQEDKRQQENATILDYIKKNNITAQPDSSGIYYISEVEGTGNTPGDSDLVVISYKAWDLKNHLIDCSDTANYNQLITYPLYQFGGPSVDFSMKYRGFPGWNLTLKKMKEGGKAIAIIPSLLTFRDYVPRKYEFQLIKVVKDISSYERQKMNNYLDGIGKAVADSTPDGIYYIEEYAGKGDTIRNNSTVYLQITGKLLDGRIFFQSDTANFIPYVIGTKQLVPGLEQVLVGKRGGTMATAILPYNKAYGKNAYPDPLQNGQVIIPWYSPLVYDIKIKEDIIK
jgi:FKBP-type peptidyl-prolyl cis-trans isomerases 1